jgi:hypothetical protein
VATDYIDVPLVSSGMVVNANDRNNEMASVNAAKDTSGAVKAHYQPQWGVIQIMPSYQTVKVSGSTGTVNTTTDDNAFKGIAEHREAKSNTCNGVERGFNAARRRRRRNITSKPKRTALPNLKCNFVRA